MEHGRFEYSAIAKRPKWELPGGARVAVWVTPNIEHFHYDKPAMSLTPMTAGLRPDVLNYAWRDYGVRVGVWRLMEALERQGFVATAALNSDFARDVGTSESTFQGIRTLEVTVRAPLPVIGFIGPRALLEVKGHAAIQR